MSPRHFAVALVAYLALLAGVDLLAYESSIPGLVTVIPMYDTIGHFALIGLAGLLLHRALGRRVARVAGIPLPVGPLLVVLGAAAEEALQLLSPVREACLSDFFADVAGIALFYALDALLCARHRRARAGVSSGLRP